MKSVLYKYAIIIIVIIIVIVVIIRLYHIISF